MTVPGSLWRIVVVGVLVAGCGQARQEALPLAATRADSTIAPAAASAVDEVTTTTAGPTSEPTDPTATAGLEPSVTTTPPDAPGAAPASRTTRPPTAAARAGSGTTPAPEAPTAVPPQTSPPATAPPATSAPATSPPPTAPSASTAAQTRAAPAPARISVASNPFASNADQCTWYAEERMRQYTGQYMAVDGDAWQWPDRAAAAGWTVASTPAVNSVVVLPAGSYNAPAGHVAWVVDVSGDQLRVQDYNWNFVGAHVTDHWVGVVPGTRFIYGDR